MITIFLLLMVVITGIIFIPFQFVFKIGCAMWNLFISTLIAFLATIVIGIIFAAISWWCFL